MPEYQHEFKQEVQQKVDHELQQDRELHTVAVFCADDRIKLLGSVAGVIRKCVFGFCYTSSPRSDQVDDLPPERHKNQININGAINFHELNYRLINIYRTDY